MVDDDNNFDEARDALEGGLKTGFAELYLDVLRTTLNNWRAGKDALGRSWPTVEPETLASRNVRTSDPRALVDTDETRASVQSDSELDLDGLQAVIGSSKAHLIHHEFGAPEAGIPARPVLRPAATYAERQAVDTIGAEIDTRLQDAEL